MKTTWSAIPGRLLAYAIMLSALFPQRGGAQDPEHETWMGFGPAGRTTYPLEVWDDALHFFALGDWGRHGEYRQAELADLMNRVAREIEPEFLLSTGDNFYPNGVASTRDPDWFFSFENVYRGHLLHCPWYVVLGNHDYRGNPEAQIEYSRISRRWTMPGRYFYRDMHTEEGVSVRFVFLDTSPFETKYYHEPEYQHQVSTQDTSAQKAWMEAVLRDPPTTWKFVIGHHPLYSGGKRRFETEDIRRSLEPVLARHRVDAYLVGHEHDIQHIHPEGKVNQIVSGAGSEIRPTGNHPGTRFAMAENGFVIFSLLPDRGLLQVIDIEGDVVYRHRFTPRSLQSAVDEGE